jgi:hypothetical protein
MEQTITQNNALYLAQKRISIRRNPLFDLLRIAPKKQRHNSRQQTIGGFVARFHLDNAR